MLAHLKSFFGLTYPTICQLKIYHLVPKIDKRVAANIYCSKHQEEYDQPFKSITIICINFVKHIVFCDSSNIKIYYDNCTATHITLRYKMEHTHYNGIRLDC